MVHHTLFHQRIAGANGDAVAAADAAGALDLLAAIPHHARHVAVPGDGQRFVHLHILAGLHAAPAKDALVGIVAIKRIGVVLRIRLLAVLAHLVLYVELARGVVHRAVAVIVVANRAIQVVIF